MKSYVLLIYFVPLEEYDAVAEELRVGSQRDPNFCTDKVMVGEFGAESDQEALQVSRETLLELSSERERVPYFGLLSEKGADRRFGILYHPELTVLGTPTDEELKMFPGMDKWTIEPYR